jgi:hypothetical protein
VKIDDFDKATFDKISEFIDEIIIGEAPSKR